MKFKIQGHPATEQDRLKFASLLLKIQNLGFEITNECAIEEYAKQSAEYYQREGRLHQLAEECSELAVAASHGSRMREGWEDEMATEIADVELMIEGARSLVPDEKLEVARVRQLERAWAALDEDMMTKVAVKYGN